MAVKIRLKRMGKIRAPYYRVVVVDSRKKRDGKVIEQIGKYHPKEEPSLIDVVSDRAQYWLSVGAQPTEAVEALLKVTGDWQKFKGLPGTEGTLKVAEPKKSKADLFNEALKDSSHEPATEAVTKKAAAKKAPAKEETPVAEDAPVVEPVETTPVAEEPPVAEAAPVVEPVETTPVTEEPPVAEEPPVVEPVETTPVAEETPTDPETAAEKTDAETEA